MKPTEEWLARQLITQATHDGIPMYQSQALRWACNVLDEWNRVLAGQNTGGKALP